MLPTSNTYKFQSIQIELIIREAFERIGIIGDFVDPQKLESAKRSIDFLLLDWMSKSVNLWTLDMAYLNLIEGKSQYILPDTVSDIIQVNLRTSTRQVVPGGVPFSSDVGSDADDAFDGNPLTSCTQLDIDGNIGYEFPEPIKINFIGITSNETEEYSIKVAYLNEEDDVVELFTIPKQEYSAGLIYWFDVPIPVLSTAYSIIEGGGAQLDIRELYFNNNVFDASMSNISRYEYYTYPNKFLESRPSVYYLDRSIQNILTVWPTPSAQYNCLQYSYKKLMQDTGSYTNTVDIPSLFYPALVWGLCYHLALKYNPEAAQTFKQEYEQAFLTATIDDSETTPLSIIPNYDYGW